MRTVSEMTEAEKYQVDDDPDLLRATQMTGSIRWLEVYRAYLLVERLEKAKRADHNEIMENWARAMGMTKDTLKTHRRWAEAIRWDDLNAVFDEEDISSKEWTTRIGTTHLKTVARAKDLATNQPLTSREMAIWVRRAYHANLKVDELEQMLRDQDLLPPKQGVESTPIEPGKLTGCRLLEMLAAHIRGDGKDFELNLTKGAWASPVRVHRLLQRVTDLIRDRHPDLAYKPPEEGKTS